MPPARYLCPRCGRQFARRPVEHTCERFAISSHLTGKEPHVRALYKEIVDLIRSLGPVQIKALKTTIALSVPAIMGYLTPQKKALKLTLLLIGEHKHPTLRKTFPMSTMKLGHEFSLAGAHDFDKELQDFIREARALGAASD